MGLLSWVSERWGLRQPAKGVVARMLERGLVNRPLTPIWDIRRFADEGYRRNVIIYACVKLRGKSAAQVKYVAKAPNKSGDLEDLPATHPLQKLLDRPNSEQSQREWVKQAWLHRDVGGANVIHKVRSRAGIIVELWNLRPDRVDPVPDAMGFIQSFDFPNDMPQRKRYAAEDIVYYPDGDYLDDHYGLSKIAVLARQGDVDNEAAEYMRSVLLNAGMPAAGLKILSQQALPPESKKQLQEEWREKYGRARNRSVLGFGEFGGGGQQSSGGWGDIAIFDADVEWIKMGSAFNEMNLNGIFQHTETRITMAFGVPAMLIGAKAGIDRSTFSNSEQAEDNFWNQTMVPDTADFAEKLEMEIAPEFGEGIKIECDYSQIRALQEDADAKAERTLKGWEAGVVMYDEVRIDLGKEPVGDNVSLVLDEETGEEIKSLGKKHKWELPIAKAAAVPAAPVVEKEEPEEPEEVDPEKDDNAKEKQRRTPKEVLARRSPAIRRLREVADGRTFTIRRAISKAFRLSKEAIEIQPLANALFVKEAMRAEQLALRAFQENGVPVITKAMTRDLGILYRSGAKIAGRDVREKQAAGAKETFAVPVFDPGKDEEYAGTRVAELVVDVSDATKHLIRQAVDGMFEDGYSARRAATRIRDTLGLTKPALHRLEKYELEKRAKGIVGADLERLLSRFSRELIRERALTIALTEGTRAISEGQNAIWGKAVREGILPGDQLQFWITVEDLRVCPICRPMDGQTIKVGETFSTGNGGSVGAPPAHPRCRCARGLK